jgi:hypothetical protein
VENRKKSLANDMLSPNTASPGRSIWDRVGREMFESHVDSLERTRYVPDSWVLSEADWPKQRDEDVLPFSVENQLSDDIAFIAACEYGVTHVTAASVERARNDSCGLVIRLAGNEGICDRAKDAIKRILSSLEQCAKKGKLISLSSWS